MRWLLLLSMLVSSQALAAEIACPVDGQGAPVVLIVGDSLSAGYGIDLSQRWTELLQQRFDEQGYEYRVVNASISGDTTSGGLTRLRTALPKFKPALVVIELGGNDGLRGFPIRTMRKNIEGMIELSTAAGARVALLGMRIPTNYGQRYADSFHEVYASLADQFDTALVPFFLDGVALDESLMQADGIHPNAGAQARLLDNAWPAIKEGLAKYCAAR